MANGIELQRSHEAGQLTDDVWRVAASVETDPREDGVLSCDDFRPGTGEHRRYELGRGHPTDRKPPPVRIVYYS